MKFTHVILITLFLLISGFTGCAAAWTSNTAAAITPSGDLLVGEDVTAMMEVIMPTDGIYSDGYLIMTTPLDSPQWSVDIKYRNGDLPLTSREGTGKTLRLSGFELSYNEEIVIAILLNGKVPGSAEGREISVISVTQDPSQGSVSQYSSPAQRVQRAGTILPDVDMASLSLRSGWNFVSVPKSLNPGANTAEALFSGVSTGDHRILTYDAAAADWVSYGREDVVRPLTGIWIYSAEPATVSLTYPSNPSAPAEKSVYPGWNAIGLSASSQTAAVNALAGVSWRTLLPWNPATGQWSLPVINGGVADANPVTRVMTTGNGYWLYVSEPGTLSGLTA